MHESVLVEHIQLIHADDPAGDEVGGGLQHPHAADGWPALGHGGHGGGHGGGGGGGGEGGGGPHLAPPPVHPLQHLLTSETSETGWVFCRAA